MRQAASPKLCARAVTPEPSEREATAASGAARSNPTSYMKLRHDRLPDRPNRRNAIVSRATPPSPSFELFIHRRQRHVPNAEQRLGFELAILALEDLHKDLPRVLAAYGNQEHPARFHLLDQRGRDFFGRGAWERGGAAGLAPSKWSVSRRPWAPVNWLRRGGGALTRLDLTHQRESHRKARPLRDPRSHHHESVVAGLNPNGGSSRRWPHSSVSVEGGGGLAAPGPPPPPPRTGVACSRTPPPRAGVACGAEPPGPAPPHRGGLRRRTPPPPTSRDHSTSSCMCSIPTQMPCWLAE